MTNSASKVLSSSSLLPSPSFFSEWCLQYSITFCKILEETLGRGMGASVPVSAVEGRRSGSAIDAPIVRETCGGWRSSVEIVGWRKGRSSGRARPLTFDHVLDSLRLEGNLLSHLDGLALRGHEGDEFVAHGARVFCVSRTKEETSGGTTRALATVRLVDVEFPRHLTSSNILHGCFQFGGLRRPVQRVRDFTAPMMLTRATRFISQKG